MPVILVQPYDPTDVLLQGEQLRSLAMTWPVGAFGPLTLISPVAQTNLLAGDDSHALGIMGFDWDTFGAPPETIRIIVTNYTVNAGIATPTGAWVPFDGPIIFSAVPQSTQRWLVQGVTRDSSGVPLGDCRVVVIETGRVTVTDSPVVAETISNGSGVYSVPVPLNTSYQIIAYKPGSPDVAGITRADVIPDPNG